LIGIVQADLKEGLVAYYPFNGNANDESGNANNGTVYGAKLTTDRFGNPNNAYSFDGFNDYIDMGNQVSTSDMKTIAVWVKFNDLTKIQEIVSKSTSTKGVEILLYNGLSFYAMGSHDSLTQFSTTFLNTIDWFFIVATHESVNSPMKLYLNGVLKGDIATAPSIIDNPGYLLAGNWSDSSYPRYFSGKIDDIRIYNRVLTDSEIQQLYSGVSPSVIVKPYTFTSGTPAKAAEVNADFDTLYQQMNALKASFCQEHPTASACQ
jgi:hypothetical protein